MEINVTGFLKKKKRGQNPNMVLIHVINNCLSGSKVEGQNGKQYLYPVGIKYAT